MVQLERRQSGRLAKGGRVQSQKDPEEEEADPFADAEEEKWRLTKVQFDSSYGGDKLGKEKVVTGKSIDKGVKKFKKNPKKYIAIMYQTSLLNRPVDRQKYTFVYREDTIAFKPLGIHDGGWMTLMQYDYESLPAFKKNRMPKEYRDEYTDDMVWQGQKIHSKTNPPICPGRGMGCVDQPNIKIVGDVDPSDISQGYVGDCWLLSGISALAEFDGAIKRLFRKTPNIDKLPAAEPNKYIVTLWDLPTWTEVDIEIDERLCAAVGPAGQLLGAKPSIDGELWVCYLEKALAIHCGGWDKIVGGQCTHAWSLLTGCKYQYTIRKNPVTGKYACYGKYIPKERRWIECANSPHDGDKRRWKIPWPEVGGGGTTELDEEELFMRMCEWGKFPMIHYS